MGYTPNRKVFKLRFEGEYEGLEVKVRSIPLGQFLKFAGLLEIDTRNPSSEDMKELEALFGSFAKVLIEWNLEDEDGAPVPCNSEGLLSQDLDMVLTIILEWSNALSSVARPLHKASNGGKQFPEALIPMETSLSSL